MTIKCGKKMTIGISYMVLLLAYVNTFTVVELEEN